MADNRIHLQEAAECLRHASQQDSITASSGMAQMALAHATLVIATELAALRQSVEALREAVTDRDGFASADHLRNINEWVERIAKS